MEEKLLYKMQMHYMTKISYVAWQQGLLVASLGISQDGGVVMLTPRATLYFLHSLLLCSFPHLGLFFFSELQTILINTKVALPANFLLAYLANFGKSASKLANLVAYNEH